MRQGFTLIEILLVLFAITSLIGLLIYFLKPAEIFKRHRDFQRINDLKTLELAINTYLMNNPNPDLDGFYFSTGYDEALPSIYISIPRSQGIATSIIDGVNKEWRIIQNASDTVSLKRIDGLGWLPINFTELKYPPLSYLPIDPINNLDQKFFYSYAFSRSTQSFELNARLEASIYNLGGSQDKTSTDGGSDNEVYEVGSNKCLIIGNKLYGEVSTTTCSQSTFFRFPINLPYQISCTNPQKITTGEWELFDSYENLVSTDTSAVHDGSTSTRMTLWIVNSYVVHKFPRLHFLNYVRLYSDYGGNKPYIKYYKNAAWTYAGENETKDCNVATTTYINTTTIGWAIGWGSNVSICEMEAYGCPIEPSWFKSFGKDIYLYDIKPSKEKYLWNHYILAGAKRVGDSLYPYLAKIDLEGNIISSSTIFISATTSYFNIVFPLDDDKNGYIDNYLFGGVKNLGNQNNALIMKIASNASINWSREIGNTQIRAFEITDNGNYLGVGVRENSGYLFIFNSSTGEIIASTTLATSSLSFNDIKDIKRTEDGYLIIGTANNKPTIAKLNPSLEILSFITFECNLDFKSIEKIPSSNLYSILTYQPTSSGSYFFHSNISSNLNIFSIIDIWDSRTISSQDICNAPSASNFKIFQNIDIVETALNANIAGLGNETIGNRRRIVFVKNGSQNYPLSVYLDSVGSKIIKNEDLSGYLIIGYENNLYGSFVMQLNENGECLNCFASVKSFPLANIFYLVKDFVKVILHTLRFLP